jgi:hypothetical protein
MPATTTRDSVPPRDAPPLKLYDTRNGAACLAPCACGRGGDGRYVRVVPNRLVLPFLGANFGLFRFWVRTPHWPLLFSLAQAFTPAERKAAKRKKGGSSFLRPRRKTPGLEKMDRRGTLARHFYSTRKLVCNNQGVALGWANGSAFGPHNQ